MEKEFIELYETMKKSADVATASIDSDEVEENRCIDAFKLLKKFPVSYQILVSTQVGKHLRVLTNHPKKKIRAFAMELVGIWKDIIIKGIRKVKKEKHEKTHWIGTSSSKTGDVKGSTMEKELIQLYEEVKKTANMAATTTNGEVEEKRCLDTFKLLKQLPINYQILVSTQVGERLRVLTKHPGKKIQAFTKDLVEMWKAMIIKEINKNKKEKVDHKVSKAETDSTENFKVEKVRKTLKIKLKVPKHDDMNIEKKKDFDNVKCDDKADSLANMAKDDVKKQVSPLEQKIVIKSGDERRDRIREILQEAFSRVLEEADEAIMDQIKACDTIRVSATVESILFQEWGYYNGAHKINYRSLMFNLKDPKNPDFRRRVVLGELEPEKLVDMKTEEMASDNRKKEIEKIKRKAMLKCESGKRAKGTTDQFVCGKCGKRKCTYYQMQTRSADEPMTTYVTCVSCNHHWKFC